MVACGILGQTEGTKAGCTSGQSSLLFKRALEANNWCKRTLTVPLPTTLSLLLQIQFIAPGLVPKDQDPGLVQGQVPCHPTSVLNLDMQRR